jgi:hypothetical protein
MHTYTCPSCKRQLRGETPEAAVTKAAAHNHSEHCQRQPNLAPESVTEKCTTRRAATLPEQSGRGPAAGP